MSCWIFPSRTLRYCFLYLGFGLLFAYQRRLVWSAIGFNLLITCMTIEWFFIMNFFWLKVDMPKYLQDNVERDFSKGLQYNNIYLWSGIPNMSSDAIDLSYLTYGATLTQALKCALANCVAFSAVLGRVGPMGAFILTILGTFGFELNRNIIEIFHYDLGDTYEIFIFGGFMGLFASLFLSFKEQRKNHT